MTPPTNQQLRYLQFQSLRGQALQHGVFTRHGGVSQGCYHALNLGYNTQDAIEVVHTNHQLAYNALGCTANHSVSTRLEHSCLVYKAEQPRLFPDLPTADALITHQPKLALTIRVADCLPILLYDPVQHALGLVHAGWKGLVAKVIAETVKALQENYGCKPNNLLAGIGPCIRKERFEVGLEVAEKLQVLPSGAEAVLPHSNPHKCWVDLPYLAHTQLQQTGVEQIEDLGICTASNTQDWFSHRAENGRTGRFALVAYLVD